MESINLYDRNDHDFRKSLGGCTFLVNGTIFRLETIARTSTHGLMTGITIENKQWVPHSFAWERGKEPDIDITFPDMGYINYKRGVAYTTRRGVRQWGIAYNRNVVGVFDDFVEERTHAKIPLASTDRLTENPEFISRLYNRYFFSFEEAMYQLESGRRIGCAITKHIAIAMSAFSSLPVIYYKRKAVGYVKDNKAYVLREADYITAITPFHMEIT